MVSDERTRKLKGNMPPFSKRVILEAKEIGLYPYFMPITGKQSHRVIINGKETIMLGSNNYLGLTEHPAVTKAAKDAIDRFGVGCTGSRYMNGTLDIHLEMEQLLCEFMHTESSLVFSTGFQTNLGTIFSMVSKEDYVLSDEYNHASIVDGCRMSKANVVIYDHNDAGSLGDGLSTVPEKAGILTITDGVFSMEGDICDLPGIHKASRKFDASILVDDAHGLGILGPNGRGTAAHFGLDVDITMGTFSKTLASMGGFIVGNEDLIFQIKHSARSLMFSAAPTPSNVATAKKALEILMDEPEHQRALWKNAEYFNRGLRDLGFDTGRSNSPIIPVIIGEDIVAVAWWKELLNRGIYTNPVVYPATPRDRNLIRNSVMSTHTTEDLNRALDAYEDISKVIPYER